MLNSINGFKNNEENSLFSAKSLNNSSNKSAKTYLDKFNSTIAKNGKNDSSNIVLVSKGETGYYPSFDLDDDGIVTLEEFNQYCSENGVSEEDKLKLISAIQSAKMTEKLQEETKKAKVESENKEEKPINEKGKNIYARKGERKYDERMDENKDSLVTYEEYQKYCENIKTKEDETGEDEAQDSTKQTTAEKEAKIAYSEPQEEPEISVETEA